MKDLFAKIVQILIVFLSALGGITAIINAPSAKTIIGEIAAIICGALMLMCSGMLIMLQIWYVVDVNNDDKK